MDVQIFRYKIFQIFILLSLTIMCRGQVLLENNTNNTDKTCTKCSEKRTAILNLSAVIFWGAQTYMSTNIVHVILCTVVVTIYLIVPRLGRGLYNRAVLRHNICLMMNGVILQILGVCELINCQINDQLMIFGWLSLQYFTIATVFWLNVICFDMTLAITRFHWIARNTNINTSDEDRRLFIYGIFVWGGSMLPTSIAALCDYIPGVPKNFPLKPNYLNFRLGANMIVNIYFFTVPTFTLILNNILFIFTTYKIIKIKRSTAIATCNQKNLLSQKYFLFLRLYLLMGAPWFFGMLLACFNKLVLLKTCRLIQPSLWILILITHKEVIGKIKSLFARYKQRRCNVTTIST